MTSHTPRKERTLPPQPAADDDAEATTDSSPIVALPADGLDVDRIDAEAPAATGASDKHGSEDKQPAADAASSATDRDKRQPSSVARSLAKILAWTAAFPVLAILPFLVVLRISVLAYQENTHDGWQALVIGILAAMILVCIYIGVFMWSFQLRRKFFMPLLNACLTAMLCYSGYALFHLAVSNAKTQEVRSYYTSLHPFLRVAVKNLTVIDEDLVLTDTQRTRADYRNMGLPPREYSLHFKQPTGFVHAVDIRTAGRSKVTNLLVELYFILMGFQTIRHVGTADHLHVALPLVDTG